MRFKTYLFDFDGTLVDSMPYFVDALLKMLDENNIEYGNDLVNIITPLGYAGIAKYFIKLGIPMTEDELIAVMKEYAYFEYLNNIPAKPNVVETLKELKIRGAELNILTASPHSVLDVCLKRLNIYDLFTNIWSCDDFKTTKSDENIYIKAAEKIDKPIDKILFLDDNLNATKTAKCAGMKVCGVYDSFSESFVDDIKTIADYYVYDISEVLEL